MAAAERRRADARANHERLLEAAEAFFAENGLDASLRVLADRAGVGIGTLYRNFPSRGDLIRALQNRFRGELDDEVAAAADIPGGWDRMVAYIDGGVAVTLRHPVLYATAEWLRRNQPDYAPDQRWNADLLGAVAQAHAEGALRSDVTATDVALVAHLLSSLAGYPEPMRSMMMARQRSIILDGLRPGAATHPLGSAALSVDDLAATVGRHRG